MTVLRTLFRRHKYIVPHHDLRIMLLRIIVVPHYIIVNQLLGPDSYTFRTAGILRPGVQLVMTYVQITRIVECFHHFIKYLLHQWIKIRMTRKVSIRITRVFAHVKILTVREEPRHVTQSLHERNGFNKILFAQRNKFFAILFRHTPFYMQLRN